MTWASRESEPTGAATAATSSCSPRRAARAPGTWATRTRRPAPAARQPRCGRRPRWRTRPVPVWRATPGRRRPRRRRPARPRARPTRGRGPDRPARATIGRSRAGHRAARRHAVGRFAGERYSRRWKSTGQLLAEAVQGLSDGSGRQPHQQAREDRPGLEHTASLADRVATARCRLGCRPWIERPGDSRCTTSTPVGYHRPDVQAQYIYRGKTRSTTCYGPCTWRTRRAAAPGRWPGRP
jgi:hypothetical protein